MNYQINYAAQRALGLISRALSAPHIPWAIRLEPRAAPQAELAGWDIATAPPETLIETKLYPRRQEVLEWVDHVEEEAQFSPEKRFQFVYGRGGGSLLESIRHLIRMAGEAGDIDVFKELLGKEGIERFNEVIARLGPDPYGLLKKIDVRNVPEDVLEEDIQVRARLLAGERGGRRLIELLRDKFSKAVSTRCSFPINALVAEVQSEGIKVQPPPEVDPADLSPHVASALALLQICQTGAGLPLEVVGAAVRRSSATLASELAPLAEGGVIDVQGELLAVGPLPSRLTPPDAGEVASRALDALVAFIQARSYEPIAQRQVSNVISLAKECVTHSRLGPVAAVFMRLDKYLKSRGDKHLVLEVANLSVYAARRGLPRQQVEVEAESRALICGVSWVYQRVGRLDEARAAGQKALELAQSIGSDVGVAFSLKCLGRLSRMQAEALGGKNPQKADKLSESITLLRASIEQFSRLSEYGPAHPEVGDCYSLLGRTYLEAGESAKADEAIRTAYRLIPDDKSKDYLDLLILSGDLEVARGNRETGEDCYTKVLAFRDPGEPSRSEIYARAYLRRGLSRAARGARHLAVRDMTEAAKIWSELGELESAATARWEAIRLTEPPSPFVLKLLECQSPAVRVTTIDLHKQRLAARAPHWPRRAQPGRAYWDQLIQDGRRRVALEVIDW